MKRNNSLVFALLALVICTTTSCEAIAGIFKAGMWVGVLLVVVVVGIIFWLISKARKYASMH